MPIAQFNIAVARYDLDDPRMAEFTRNVGRINSLARRSEGYVWRLEDEDGPDAPKFPNEPRMTFTLSVWHDLKSLSHFSLNTIHKRFRQRGSEWFLPAKTRYLVIWPVDEGHRPSGAEALERLAELDRMGPSERVLGTEALVAELETS